MYTIKGHGMVWDAEAGKPLIRFKDGEAKTDSKAIADRLKKLGYDVSGSEPKKNKTEKADE